jgi:pimeloyl-ACP methyl ester carboxylesterase
MRFRLSGLTSACLVVAGMVVFTAACSSKPPTPQTTPLVVDSSVPQAPAGDAFYQPPQPSGNAHPGGLIWSRAIDAPDNSQGFAFLYWSTGLDGKLTAVSAVLFAPKTRFPEPVPILAWAHGTFGMADACAPSKAYFAGQGPSLPLVRRAISQGAVFVATDYVGLGTPGEHPYLVGESSGRAVLDSIRAAATFIGEGDQAQAVVMGQSQGGQASVAAAELQPTYAPELKLRAAVGVSTPSRLDLLDQQLSGGPYFGYVVATTYGYEVAYPSLAADNASLTAKGRQALDKIGGYCTDQMLSSNAGGIEKDYGLDKVLHAKDFSAMLARNEPGQVKTSVPIFLVHGEADDTIPVQNTRDLVSRSCALGDIITAKFYPGAGHVDVLAAALNDIESYLSDRLNSKAVPSACTPPQTP